MLFVLAGLPGVGKTSLATALSRTLKAAHLRIDTIEQTLRAADVLKADVGSAGYLVGYSVALENLRRGVSVVADSVNPLAVTRDGWLSIGKRAGVSVVEVEVVCSDVQEHRSRVETRVADIPGHRLPTWREVVEREYEPWQRKPIVIDTAYVSVEANVTWLLRALGLASPPPRRAGARSFF